MHTQAKRSWRRLVRLAVRRDELVDIKLGIVEVGERIERLKRDGQRLGLTNVLADLERQTNRDLKDLSKRVDTALADVGGDDTSGAAKPVAARTRSRRG